LVGPGGRSPATQKYPPDAHAKGATCLAGAGRSPRSIQSVFATFRAIWNHARNTGFVQVQCPTKGVALPKVNNERKRYLTRAEADALLTELTERSPHA